MSFKLPIKEFLLTTSKYDTTTALIKENDYSCPYIIHVYTVLFFLHL